MCWSAGSKLGLPCFPGGGAQKTHQVSDLELNVGAQRGQSDQLFKQKLVIKSGHFQAKLVTLPVRYPDVDLVSVKMLRLGGVAARSNNKASARTNAAVRQPIAKAAKKKAAKKKAAKKKAVTATRDVSARSLGHEKSQPELMAKATRQRQAARKKLLALQAKDVELRLHYFARHPKKRYSVYSKPLIQDRIKLRKPDVEHLTAEECTRLAGGKRAEKHSKGSIWLPDVSVPGLDVCWQCCREPGWERRMHKAGAARGVEEMTAALVEGEDEAGYEAGYSEKVGDGNVGDWMLFCPKCYRERNEMGLYSWEEGECEEQIEWSYADFVYGLGGGTASERARCELLDD